MMFLEEENSQTMGKMYRRDKARYFPCETPRINDEHEKLVQYSWLCRL
jgi:hypothetical protein